MLTAALLSTVLLGQAQGATAAQPAPVLVNRVFKKGEVDTYRMNALLVIEMREPGLETYMPMEVGYEYSFTTSVSALDADGNATMRYERGPTVRIDGAYGSTPERRVRESDGFKMDLVVTPINEFIKAEEVKPPAKPAPRKTNTLRAMMQQGPGQQITDQLMGQYIMDLYRLSLFVGSFESSFDFTPKFLDSPIRVGRTWRSTISYQPQRLAGTNRQAVQRLDMVYRYDGPMTVNGKPIQRVSATLGLDTDMAPFIAQTYGIPANQNPFRAMRMKFDSKLTFDLDPKTFKTIRARSDSTGNILVETKADGVIAERRLTGESNFQLVSTRMATAPATPRRGGSSPR